MTEVAREQCAKCQQLISEQRLEAMQGTRLCVKCASEGAFEDERRFTRDSWRGSRRGDGKRDWG